MKKYSLAIILGLLVKLSSAQFSLAFCEDVTSDGKPTRSSNSFLVGTNGSALKCLLKVEGKLNTEQIDYRIYIINEAGKEEELLRMPQKVQPDWNYTWKELVFFDPGIYRVKIYNDKGAYLTSANLSVKKQ